MPDMFAHYLVAEAGGATRRRRPAPRRRLRRLQGGRAGPGRVLLLAPGARSPRAPEPRPPHAPAPDGRGVPQHARPRRSARRRGSAAPPSPSSPGTPRTCAWTRRPTRGCSTGRGTSPTEPIALAKAEAFRRHGILEASIDVILTRERSDDTAWLRRQRLLRLPPAQATIGRDAAERHAERRLRRDVHPRGGTLRLPRHGVGLHDDERSARPARRGFSGWSRPRSTRAASCAPRSTPRPRRLPPPASTPGGSALVLPLAAGRAAHHDVRGDPRDRDGRDGALPRGDRRRGRSATRPWTRRWPSSGRRRPARQREFICSAETPARPLTASSSAAR